MLMDMMLPQMEQAHLITTTGGKQEIDTSRSNTISAAYRRTSLVCASPVVDSPSGLTILGPQTNSRWPVPVTLLSWEI